MEFKLEMAAPNVEEATEKQEVVYYYVVNGLIDADGAKEIDGSSIEVSSLEDLENLSKNFDCELVINMKEKKITLYDWYIE